MIISGYKLEMTCGACPEQYDVIRNNKIVGYLRLRHGHFSARYPECGGKVVYDSPTNGDGCFDDNERMIHLTKAIDAISREDEQKALDMISEKEG